MDILKFGLNFLQGQDSRSVYFEAGLSLAQRALNGVQYQNDLDFHGSDTLNVTGNKCAFGNFWRCNALLLPIVA